MLVATLAVAIYSVTAVRKSYPDTSGNVNVNGLHSSVTVARDAHGIPTITASTSDDLYFAQGYVHAQDRFFEMDFRRHVTAGRLAELVGKNALETDKFVRTLGWRRVAEAEWKLLAPETQAMLEAYAAGVNAYIEGKPASRLSLEYSVLDLAGPTYTPEPWTPADSIAWSKAMAWDLRSNMSDELTRSWLAATLPRDRVEQLYPGYPSDHEPIVSSGGVSGGVFVSDDGDSDSTGVVRSALSQLDAAANAAEVVPALLGVGDGIGSNSWVVSGEHTKSGKPLLANDPHLGASMPGVWYQNQLRCAKAAAATCNVNVAGFSFTGLPSVIVGHTGHAAWGVTNLTADVSDLYIERIDGDTYLDHGKQVPLEIRQEKFKVAGGNTETMTVRSTRRGPILSDLHGDATQAYGSLINNAFPGSTKGAYAVSLRWTALTPQKTVDALSKLGSADSWSDLREAAQLFSTPSQNLVYADVEGNIGYQAPGMIPIRSNGDGRWPAPAWDGANEWTSTIPFAELPSVLNPDEGFIVTANNQVIGKQYPYYLGADVAPGYRSERIRALLKGRDDLTVDDMTRLQMDEENPVARLLVPYLLTIRLESAYYRQGTDTLRDWDFQQPADSKAAAYFNTVWKHVLDLTFNDELPANARPTGGERWYAVMAKLVNDPDSKWWDNVDTPGVETRDDILAQAMREARDELTRTQSRHPNKWRWGVMHQLKLTNPTLGTSGVALVERLFNRGPYEVGGGGGTVNATAWDATKGYEVTSLPSMRMVVDLGDLDKSRWIQLTGNSGHAFHRNYVDQAALWVKGETLGWAYSAKAVKATTKHTLTLAPTR